MTALRRLTPNVGQRFQPVSFVEVIVATLAQIPAQVAGGVLALVLLALGLSAVPRTVRRELATSLRAAWHAQVFSLSAGGEGRGEVVRFRKRFMPSYFWRFASLFTAIALLVSDPHFDALFTAQAACPIPSNSSTETTRLTEFAYDDEGRLTQVNAPEGVINYGYDLATGRHTSTCTTNSEVAYGYDQLGRLKTVSVLKRNGVTVSPPEVTTYTYTAVGSRETVTLPNGIVTTWRYDNLNRLTNLVHQFGTTNLATYNYQLHATGRRTNATEILLNTNDNSYVTNTLTWQYDGMYRLTNEVSTSSLSTLAYTRTYEYDKAGNRVKQTRGTETITYQYNANDQLTTEVSSVSGTTTYLYDANGSLTNETTSGGTTISYAYNLANKLSSVNVGGVATSYLYNDQGIRVRSVTGASTNLYLVDANNHTGYAQILEELGTIGGAASCSYVIGDDVLGQATSTTTSWLLYDGHGSTRQLVKAGADVTSQYHFDGYGASLTTLPSNPETSLLYSGEQFDTTLQMYNLRARYYDQNTGRFNQRDTFAGTNSDPLSLHRYTFAGSDPVNGLDPSGRFTVVEFVLVTAIVVLLAAIAVQAVSKAKSKAYKQVVVNDLRQLLAYERVFSIDEIRDFTFDPLAKGIPTDINDAAVGAGGPPGGPVNTFGVDGLTDANRAQLTVEAYSFPPIEHDPPFFGNEWGVFRSQQTKSPVLVYNAYESEDGVNLPLDVSWCAVFVQDDSRFGLKAPRNRQHWYCVFAGSQTSRFFEGRYYKIPLDVQERWILEGNAWFRGSGFLELGAGQEDELIDENEY